MLELLGAGGTAEGGEFGEGDVAAIDPKTKFNNDTQYFTSTSPIIHKNPLNIHTKTKT